MLLFPSSQVSLDLPEDGLVLWSFVRGLLGLYVSADGSLTLYGLQLTVPGTLKTALPAGWPSAVATVTVNNMAVGKLRGVRLTCMVAAGAGTLSCEAS